MGVLRHLIRVFQTASQLDLSDVFLIIKTGVVGLGEEDLCRW